MSLISRNAMGDSNVDNIVVFYCRHDAEEHCAICDESPAAGLTIGVLPLLWQSDDPALLPERHVDCLQTSIPHLRSSGMLYDYFTHENVIELNARCIIPIYSPRQTS